MRRNADAPVDTVGCGSLAQKNVDEKTRRFQTLIALMLSAQTKDTITAKAMTALQSYGLTADKMADTPEATINQMISMVGFHNRKAKSVTPLPNRIDANRSESIATIVITIVLCDV